MLLLNASPAASIGGKLPLTVYESIYEADERDPTKPLGLKFVPIKYTIETGEAERIGMDMVAKSAQAATDIPLDSKETNGNGKEKETADGGANKEKNIDVGPQNDELIGALTARKNAIVMLTSRIKLLLKFLQNPPEGVTNQQILREIKSLTHSRLPLLKPADQPAFDAEKSAEEADVHLVQLLGELTKSIEGVASVGRKFGGVQTMEKRMGGYRQDPHESMMMENYMPIGGPRRSGRFSGGGGFGMF